MTPRKLKITTFGTTKSGKTSIAHHILGNPAPNTYVPTICVDFLTRTVADPLKPGARLILQIWDTSMGHSYSSVGYLKGTDIIFYVMDATAKSLDDQFDAIRQTLKLPAKNTQLVLILNKTDLLTEEEVKIKEDTVKTFMAVEIYQREFTFYSVSAKDEVDKGMVKLIEETINRVPPLSDADKANKLHKDQRQTINNVCDAYHDLTKKRYYFSTDLTRNATVRELASTIEGARSQVDIIAALVQAVKDIRQPTKTNRRKYGVTFFFGMFHYGSYKNSELYKLIKAELYRLDPTILSKLDELTRPAKISYRSASVYPLKRA